jgi:predicted nucleic acid-binding protein
MKYVIDASVAAKWCLPAASEPLLREANELLRQQVNGEVQFVVPDLFWAEIGNVLWKAVRVGRCGRASAEMSLHLLKRQRLPTFSSESLVEQALAIALTFERSAYDSIYVALALDTGAQLITADEKLANALAARMPVKWLGALYRA